MAHTGIFATSAEITQRAGTRYYSTGVTEAVINALCLQCESLINVSTGYNWSDAYATLNADFKGILSAAEADWVGMMIIITNMEGYAGLNHAQTMIDVLRDDYNRCIETLKKKDDAQAFMGAI